MKNAREREKFFIQKCSESGKLTSVKILPIRNYQMAHKVNFSDQLQGKIKKKSKKSWSTKILEMQINHISI